jgi:glycosyltransferase involved in cell wall biosynthesis
MMLRTEPQSIAVLIGGLGQGGSERQLYCFLERCDRTRWAPTVYVSSRLGTWEKPIRNLGIPIFLLRGNPLAKMLMFRRAVRTQNAKCFFSWSSYTNGFALALFGLGVRRIGSFRNTSFDDLPTNMRLFWSWFSSASLSTIVCNSRETQMHLARYTNERTKVVYVPNAVQTFPPEQILLWREKWRAQLGLNQDEILVLGVGRLTPQKRFDRFITAIGEVREHLSIQAVIAGEDRGCLVELQQLVTRLGLSKRIQLIGKVPDARELMCAGDIFMLCSDKEGMPNVVLEAMAVSVPCITTRVNGVSDAIQHGSSGFLASTDPSELAQYIVTLATDAELRRQVGGRGQLTIEKMCQPEMVARQLWKLCEASR